MQVHLYGDLITHRWIVFIIISHLGQHWIIQRSSLNFWRVFAALKVKGLNNFALYVHRKRGTVSREGTVQTTCDRCETDNREGGPTQGGGKPLGLQ